MTELPGPAPAAPHRAITGFFHDAQGEWVAQLSCGHTQHVRHRPPLSPRTWVTTAAGRAARIGTELACVWCTMPTLPQDVVFVRATKVFDEDTIPVGLRQDHRTRADTWGRIVVHEGALLYARCPPHQGAWVLRPTLPGIIEPGVLHRVTPQGPLRFLVEFWRHAAG